MPDELQIHTREFSLKGLKTDIGRRLGRILYSIMAGAAGSEEEEWKRLLRKHRVQLLKSMKFQDTLLLDFLVQSEVVSQEQYLSQKGHTDLEMGRYVLDLIAFKHQYEGLLQALRDSDQSHVADLLKEEPRDVPFTKMKSLNLNQVTVSLVAPWCDKMVLQKEGIQFEETWLTSKAKKSSVKQEELQQRLRFLIHTLRKLISSTQSQGTPASILKLHHIVVGKTVAQDDQDVLLDIITTHPRDIVYFACNMERPISSRIDIAEKFIELSDLSVVITDATCSNLKNGMIQMGYPCFECITVGYKSTPSDRTPYGGLVDMVVPKNVEGTDEKGRGYVIKYDSCPGVYAVATVVSILQGATSLSKTQAEHDELKRSRTMRRILISMCSSAHPWKHDAVDGFGTLKPERFLKNPHGLEAILQSSLSYWRSRHMPREDQHNKGVNLYDRPRQHKGQIYCSPTYTETNKTSLIRQLTSHQVDSAHKVVVGILGSGLNPNHPLLAGLQLDLSSVSVCEQDEDQTKDTDDHTTEFTACLINLLCTAGGDSLLNRVRLVHVKFIASDGAVSDEEYRDSLEQFLHQGVHVLLLPFSGLHPVATWSGVKLIQHLRNITVFITPATFYESEPGCTFPVTEVLAVGGVTSDGRLQRDAAAGPLVDFVAPVQHQSIGHGRVLPENHTENATSFTGAVTVYMLLLARIHGLEESRIRRLSTTSVMRAILIEMCSHPERRTASMGYGVLDPWSFLNDWTKLSPIVMKYTDPDAEPTLWAGKDI